MYNPYVLYLLHVKMRYLFNVLNRLYRRRLEHDSDAAFTYLLDCCVLNNLYAKVLIEDLILMQERMREQPFPLDLARCHFEYYLFRATQLFRSNGDGIDLLFASSYFKCESRLSIDINRDIHVMSIQRLIATYTENYYFRHSTAQSQQRVTLFFNMKLLLERAVTEARLDKEDSLFYIRYDSELTAILFYLYLISELYCLNEIDALVLNPSLIVADYNVKQRRLFDSCISNVALPLQSNVKEQFTMSHQVLHKAFKVLADLFHTLVLDRLTFYSKSTTSTTTTSTSGDTGFFSSIFSSLPEQQQQSHSNLHRENYENYVKVLNREYRLTRPPSEPHSLADNRVNLGTGEYYEIGSRPCAKLIPITYLPLRENPLLYTLCLYRLAFDIKVAEAHSDCRGSTFSVKGQTYGASGRKPGECYLCAYGKRSNGNNEKVRDFIELCRMYTLENPSQTEEFIHLSVQLEKLYIDLMPSHTLRHFKTLTSVCWLFEYLPLAPSPTGSTKNDRAVCHNLLRMINPVTLIDDLTRHTTHTKLDKAMWDLISTAYKKLRINHTLDVIEREQALSLECEIARLFTESVNMQCNEIQRYERSQSIELSLDSTHMCREVGAALKKIYMGHLNILLQVIMEMHDGINFDI